MKSPIEELREKAYPAARLGERSEMVVLFSTAEEMARKHEDEVKQFQRSFEDEYQHNESLRSQVADLERKLEQAQRALTKIAERRPSQDAASAAFFRCRLEAREALAALTPTPVGGGKEPGMKFDDPHKHLFSADCWKRSAVCLECSASKDFLAGASVGESRERERVLGIIQDENDYDSGGVLDRIERRIREADTKQATGE